MNPSLPPLDRFRGAMLGLAAGDALGATVEFHIRGHFPPLTGMIGGGPHDVEPGQWTDDTSMALCLAESLVERGGFDAADQMRRYVRWWREGHNSSKGYCFDIGNTTREALARFEATGNPFSGDTHPGTAGNGSLMRLAPVVLCHAHDHGEAVARAADSSRTTHGAAEAVDACRLFASLLHGALSGRGKDELLPAARAAMEASGSLAPAVAAIAAGSHEGKDERTIRSSGYVVHTLEAALWAFFGTGTFKDGVLKAVNLGDDADTVGAVYGQLAGAYYGAPAIPAEWVDLLWRRDDIITLADRLHDLSRSR